jgi:hypothetical protein
MNKVLIGSIIAIIVAIIIVIIIVTIVIIMVVKRKNVTTTDTIISPLIESNETKPSDTTIPTISDLIKVVDTTDSVVVPTSTETAVEVKNEKTPTRYVRFRLVGANRCLQLAEVKVMKNGVNIARNKVVKQSSTIDPSFPAEKAVDEIADGFSSTNWETDPWFLLDLGSEVVPDSIIVYGRAENQDRLNNLYVELLTSSGGVYSSYRLETVGTKKELIL